MYGQGVRGGFLVHLYLVRIIDDDVELSESSIVDQERRRLFSAVVDVAMSVHVGDGLSVTRVPQQLHGVCDYGLVRVDVSFAYRRGYCIAEPTEARDGIVLNDLIHVRHFETRGSYTIAAEAWRARSYRFDNYPRACVSESP